MSTPFCLDFSRSYGIFLMCARFTSSSATFIILIEKKWGCRIDVFWDGRQGLHWWWPTKRILEIHNMCLLHLCASSSSFQRCPNILFWNWIGRDGTWTPVSFWGWRAFHFSLVRSISHLAYYSETNKKKKKHESGCVVLKNKH